MAAFTTIAAGAGLLATVGGTAMSFATAAAEKKKARAAEQKSEEEQRKFDREMEVNYMDALAVQKEPYELQREAMKAQGAQLTEAAREGERGAGEMAGRILASQQQVQGDIRADMATDMYNLDASKAEEGSRMRDIRAGKALETAAGYEMEARDSKNLAAQNMQQGMQGVVNSIGQAAAFVPLYQTSAAARQGNKIANIAGREGVDLQKSISGLEGIENVAASSDYQAAVGTKGMVGYKPQVGTAAKQMYKGVDITGLADMTPMQRQDFLSQQNADWVRGFRNDLGLYTRGQKAYGAVEDAFNYLYR